MKFRAVVATRTAVATALSLAACSDSEESTEVIVGTTDAAKLAWTTFEEVAKEKGYNIRISSYEDYSTPNVALAQSQDDMNNFQTLRFLAQYNSANNDKLVPIVSTEVIPLALFWQGHDSLDGIDGQEVAIPNDPSNQGRALNVLAAGGLVELTGDSGLSPTPADIDEEASRVKVTPVDAAQTTSAYSEGKPAVINNSFLERAGIDPNSSIYADDPNSEEAAPYINAFVVREEDRDNELYREIAEVWHDPKVQEAVDEDSQGTSVQMQVSEDEMDEILDGITAELDGSEAE